MRRKPPGYYTHVEVDKLGFLSLTVASIPFSDRNQAPRNMYQAAMGKQALALPSMNFALRMSDKVSFVNTTVAKPLVDTYVGRMESVAELTRGTEMVVAICCYTGFNQEDSVVWSQGAIDRGLGLCVYYSTYRSEITSRGTEEESFERPLEHGDAAVRGLRASANYSKLDADGFVAVGTRVEPGDAIIGKVVVTQDPETDVPRKRDRSKILGKNAGGVVDRVMLTTNANGKPSVVVRIAQTRFPEVGDKFSSRHGQKGTIGLILPQEDMPFSEQTGMCPDVIVNPNASVAPPVPRAPQQADTRFHRRRRYRVA